MNYSSLSGVPLAIHGDGQMDESMSLLVVGVGR